eukprot:69489_1
MTTNETHAQIPLSQPNDDPMNDIAQDDDEEDVTIEDNMEENYYDNDQEIYDADQSASDHQMSDQNVYIEDFSEFKDDDEFNDDFINDPLAQCVKLLADIKQKRTSKPEISSFGCDPLAYIQAQLNTQNSSLPPKITDFQENNLINNEQEMTSAIYRKKKLKTKKTFFCWGRDNLYCCGLELPLTEKSTSNPRCIKCDKRYNRERKANYRSKIRQKYLASLQSLPESQVFSTKKKPYRGYREEFFKKHIVTEIDEDYGVLSFISKRVKYNNDE